MIRPLSVYLADLTYATLSLATEAFPLNIGFVAAYCRKRFGREVDLRLFKYIDDLDRALRETPPDVLAMSNYPWNRSADMEFFAMCEAVSPSTIRVMGGPNLSQIPEAQAAFIQRHPLVDFYVYGEGEAAFSLIIERMLARGPDRDALKTDPIDGVIFRAPDGAAVRGPMIARRKDLDEIPSPYLEGFMDPFFDDRLSPLLETNRGCPFGCTFCHEGNPLLNKVNYFSVERAKAELDYVAARIGPVVTNLMFADPNFGMYERDFEICEHIARIQERQGYPKFIFASTGKNQKERIGAALKLLKGSMKLWMSVQSMDERVLKEIKRDNIKLSHMMALRETFSEMGLTTFSELILGLPCETYESHVNSIARLVDSGVDQVTTYTLMLLEGTELATPESRSKHGIRSHFRILPRDFARLSNGRVAVEIEEVCTSTATLSFDEYQRLRVLHLIVNVVCNGKPFGPLLRFFREKGVSVFELLKALAERLEEAPADVAAIVDSFRAATRSELWDSREALREHVQGEESYQKLLHEELGTNLIQTHLARSGMSMDAWARYVAAIARDVLEPHLATGAEREALEDLIAWCRGRVARIWSADREDAAVRETLRHDLGAWLETMPGTPIARFRMPEPAVFEFRFTEEQREQARKFIRRFGTTPTGIGRILMKMDMTRIWRDSVLRESSSAGKEVAA